MRVHKIFCMRCLEFLALYQPNGEGQKGTSVRTHDFVEVGWGKGIYDKTNDFLKR